MSESPSDVARLRLGPIENPVRGLLHGSLALVSLSLTTWLLSLDAPRPYAAPFALLAGTHACLYLTSAIYHTVPWSPVQKHRMRRIDHSMIYVAVAGTVTAFVTVALEGWLLALVCGATWTIAALCVLGKLTHRIQTDGTMVALQVGLAGMALTALPSFTQRFPGPPTLLLAFGMLCFALGAACWVTRSPKLWPRVFSFHEVFHLCTVLGSAAHYVIFARYLSQVG